MRRRIQRRGHYFTTGRVYRRRFYPSRRRGLYPLNR